MTSLSHRDASSFANANGNGAAHAAPESCEDWPAVLRSLIGPLTQLQEQHRTSLTTLERLHTLLAEASARDTVPATVASDRGSPAKPSDPTRTASAAVAPSAEQPLPESATASAGSGEQPMTPPPGSAFTSSAAPAVPEPPADSDASTPPGRASGGTDFTPLLLSVIADVTGYPEDVLTPDMSLEEELGIDSIKRVQILAIVRDQVPGLDDANGAEMARLRTIADVAQRLGELTGAVHGQDS
ncbi:phosphopantetheine-binding protein [Streptomyces enissocaesilis]|uniref:Carrier domain-containing protein n=1 Tax=Streptomyces enissocaesilis TaxID=332589 RepID=A0ABN3WN01_9ACTN